jgi:hypothetical protein
MNKLALLFIMVCLMTMFIYTNGIAKVNLGSSNYNMEQQIKATSADEDNIPSEVEVSTLEPNYPNPFNPDTTIEFNIGKGDRGVLTVFNSKGQAILLKKFASGDYEYEWDAGDLPSGVYMYRLKTNTIDITKKMVLMK